MSHESSINRLKRYFISIKMIGKAFEVKEILILFSEKVHISID